MSWDGASKHIAAEAAPTIPGWQGGVVLYHRD